MASKTPDPEHSDEAVESQSHDCDQCDVKFKRAYTLTSHLIKKHKQIQQLDGAIGDVCDDSEEELAKNELWKEPTYVVKFDSDGKHVGKGSEGAVSGFQLCEFLKTPPARVSHPDYGLGTFVKIDEREQTYVYQFDSILSEV